MRAPGSEVGLGDAASCGALRAHRELPPCEDRLDEVDQRDRVLEPEVGHPAGTPSQTASPVSHSEVPTPEATAVAATVRAWESRSGASAPQVTLTTRRRATTASSAGSAPR